MVYRDLHSHWAPTDAGDRGAALHCPLLPLFMLFSASAVMTHAEEVCTLSHSVP